jgi:hypothetical protein
LKKEFISYNVKTIETPTTIEVWEYLDESILCAVTVGDKEQSKIECLADKQKPKDLDEKSAAEYYDSLKRKQKHYEQMRWVIARLIDCNFDNSTKFMTLTFSDNIQDIKYTNYEFSKFIKRLNFHLFHVKKQQLKYLAVWEKQKRGAIHYHIIFFSFPFIKAKELQEIWGHGFIKINKIDVDSKDNRGRYVSKYFSKNIDDKNYKQKSFFKSQNLIQPIIRHMTACEWFDFSNQNVVFSKTYSRKIPEFHNPIGSSINGIENNISFREGTVRYTRIRKEVHNDCDNEI